MEGIRKAGKGEIMTTLKGMTYTTVEYGKKGEGGIPLLFLYIFIPWKNTLPW